MNRPEADLQIQVADLLRLHEWGRKFIFFSIPNELLGSARTNGGLGRMVRFKRMGLLPGVADIIIVRDGRVYFLELKSPKGRQSDSQLQFESDAIRAGAKYAIAHNIDEAIDSLRIWGIIE